LLAEEDRAFADQVANGQRGAHEDRADVHQHPDGKAESVAAQKILTGG
jgi:hypothetical protein